MRRDRLGPKQGKGALGGHLCGAGREVGKAGREGHDTQHVSLSLCLHPTDLLKISYFQSHNSTISVLTKEVGQKRPHKVNIIVSRS